MSILCTQWHMGRPSPWRFGGKEKKKKGKEIGKKKGKGNRGEQSNRGMMKNGER